MTQPDFGTQQADIFGIFVVKFYLVFPPANTQNNLETSDVSKSEHFSVAASILEVSTFLSTLVFSDR